MREFLIRSAALTAIAVFAVVSWAQTGVPGGVGILGMVCQTVPHCGYATQVDRCSGKNQGASCTFCTAGVAKHTCRPHPTRACRVGSYSGCGLKLGGFCTPFDDDGDPGTPEILICTGNDYVGPCKLSQCSNPVSP